MPARSDASTSACPRALPTPLPRSLAATYMLTSATPRYQLQLETGMSAAHATTRPSRRATSRHSREVFRSHSSQTADGSSNVAWPVAMPSA